MCSRILGLSHNYVAKKNGKIVWVVRNHRKLFHYEKLFMIPQCCKFPLLPPLQLLLVPSPLPPAEKTCGVNFWLIGIPIPIAWNQSLFLYLELAQYHISHQRQHGTTNHCSLLTLLCFQPPSWLPRFPASSVQMLWLPPDMQIGWKMLKRTFLVKVVKRCWDGCSYSKRYTPAGKSCSKHIFLLIDISIIWFKMVQVCSSCKRVLGPWNCLTLPPVQLPAFASAGSPFHLPLHRSCKPSTCSTPIQFVRLLLRKPCHLLIVLPRIDET